MSTVGDGSQVDPGRVPSGVWSLRFDCIRSKDPKASSSCGPFETVYSELVEISFHFDHLGLIKVLLDQLVSSTHQHDQLVRTTCAIFPPSPTSVLPPQTANCSE